MNRLEQKILDFIPSEEYRNTIVNMAKTIGCSRRVMHKYLDILQAKGYITRRVEPVKGGTTGDKSRITIIEKIKA